MQNKKTIISLISEARFATYKIDASDTFEQILLNIEWNIKLSRAFYPLLQGIEVGLRNSLCNSISSHLKDDNWLLNPTILKANSPEVKMLEEKTYQAKNKGIIVDSHKLMALLPFGFWTNLLNIRYENVFWPQLIKTTFPFLPRKMRTRKIIDQRFNKIRIKLRNRISHHQKIYHLNLKEIHKELLETIHWLAPEYLEWVRIYDEFPSLFAMGREIAIKTHQGKIYEPAY